ncbi:MAG: nucleoside diphosphate kinase regulator, partial [Pseudomonas sp.]|nr:nucleoside diphosphate kinase regulator [Pseudomonas sp.]
MSAPSITITRLDLQRLERVLASLQDVTPGVEALE